jgi:hypothetical protein
VNTIKINRIRSALLTQGNRLAEDAYEVIVWAMTLGGPIAIADQASWELVRSECEQHVADGHTWYSTGPSQFELDVETDEHEREISNSVARAIRYLAARELLVPNAEFPMLVRASDELESRFS